MAEVSRPMDDEQVRQIFIRIGGVLGFVSLLFIIFVPSTNTGPKLKRVRRSSEIEVEFLPREAARILTRRVAMTAVSPNQRRMVFHGRFEDVEENVLWGTGALSVGVVPEGGSKPALIANDGWKFGNGSTAIQHLSVSDTGWSIAAVDAGDVLLFALDPSGNRLGAAMSVPGDVGWCYHGRVGIVDGETRAVFGIEQGEVTQDGSWNDSGTEALLGLPAAPSLFLGGITGMSLSIGHNDSDPTELAELPDTDDILRGAVATGGSADPGYYVALASSTSVSTYVEGELVGTVDSLVGVTSVLITSMHTYWTRRDGDVTSLWRVENGNTTPVEVEVDGDPVEIKELLGTYRGVVVVRVRPTNAQADADILAYVDG